MRGRALVAVMVSLAVGGSAHADKKPKRPSARLGSANVDSLDRNFRSAVADVFERSLPKLTECYAHALERKPDLQCSLSLSMNIVDGSVTYVRAEDMRDDDERAAAFEVLSKCATELVRTMRFPAKKEDTKASPILLFDLR